MKGYASYCPKCEEDRTEEQTITVPSDDNGNGPFIGCRVCKHRTVWKQSLSDLYEGLEN